MSILQDYSMTIIKVYNILVFVENLKYSECSWNTSSSKFSTFVLCCDTLYVWLYAH